MTRIYLVPPTLLRRLDLSNNKLRSLPAEIGDCVKLQELMLNNNYMRMLPYELGKLFQLVILGLKGNPLGPDILQMYAEPNGTKKLLEFMLDNLHGRIRMRMPVSRCDVESRAVVCEVSSVQYSSRLYFPFRIPLRSRNLFSIRDAGYVNLFTKYSAIFLNFT